MRDDTHGPADDISIRFLDDAAVLFDRSRQALFAANLNAAVIWQGLEHRLAPGEVAQALTEEYGVDRAVARRHVAETLRQWRHWCRVIERDDTQAAQRDAASRPPLPFSPTPAASIAQYRVLDTSFTVRYGDGVPYPEIDRVLRHLREDVPAGSHEQVLDVLRHDGGFAVAEDGRIRYACNSAMGTAAMVKACVAECALDDCEAADAVHAAAVQRGGACILLPGASGSGKSCLAAGLTAEGFTLLGDDTVVLTRDEQAVRPLPFGICVKETAAEVLASRFPGLAELPVHTRPDGKGVRYLTPPEIAVANTGRTAKASQIVFPTYTPGGGTELVPLSTSAALQRLLQCFVPLGGTMEAHDVDALIDWIEATPCFALRMSSLTEAVGLLNHFDG